MPKRPAALDVDPVLSRKHTGELLRQLRRMRDELRALKQRVSDIETDDKSAKMARRVIDRRRAS